MRSDIEQLLDDLKRAGTWTAAREALIRRLEAMPAEELADTLQDPLTLLQLAGRASEKLLKPKFPTLGKDKWFEAIDYLREKTSVTRDQYDAMVGAARHRAFTVAHVTHLDLIEEVKRSLAFAQTKDTRYSEWRDEQWDKLAKEWELHGGPRTPDHIAWRLETIWRTNNQSALNAGRYAQQIDPDILALRPFWWLVVVNDGRTSDVCSKFISPKVVLRANDPWWTTHYPPLHYNCRSRVTTLDEHQARSKGILTQAPPDLADEGFGAVPGETVPKWTPDLSERDQELAEVTNRKLEQFYQRELEQDLT